MNKRKVAILIDKPSFSALREGRLLTGYEQNFLLEKCARAGLTPGEVQVAKTDAVPLEADIIVTMGEQALQLMTDKKSIWKWHLSCLNGVGLFSGTKIMPTFDFSQMFKEWHLGLYFEMALKRAAKHATPGPWIRKEERYVLGPSPDESISRIESLIQNPQTTPWLSIDVETGRNQINTFGVAWSGSDALAVKVLPDGMPANAFHKLWSVIRILCESDVPKVMQNGIYERTYLSRYGIHINAFKHDTMCAQKFLWPELEKGLDNVGRIYTMEPYWKDDSKNAVEAGKQKDWGNIRDWDAHFRYNCADTSNTLIAMYAQRKDLEERGLRDLYDSYIVRLFNCVHEMCARGLPLNTDKQKLLIAEYEAKSKSLVAALSTPINPRSPKAKQKLLKDKGYALPVKRKTGKESVDELSLKRLRLKHPEDKDLQILLEVAGVDKALSSYLRVKTLSDKRIRFMLDCCSTETFRMSCSLDPWNGGMNIQTMNQDVKQMIEWTPESEMVFLELDLEQAESRFVAFDACEDTLLNMLENKQDIHRFVAAEIYQKPMADITHEERQLGKKSSHGANYGMGVATFQDSCLRELDLVLDRKMATRVLDSFHRVFPRIRTWHSQIQRTVYNERKLTNPSGAVRYFYGRISDETYRQAYAWKPQSYIPFVTNQLMLHLVDQRTAGKFNFELGAQIHDSVLLSCKRDQVKSIVNFALQTSNWQPEAILPAGKLIIPVAAKFGPNLGSMEKFKH